MALAAGPEVLGIVPATATAPTAPIVRKHDQPGFEVRASPRMGLAQPLEGGWCLPVLLTAEIRGPETPELYCPKVEWRWPNDTVSTVESDCPPFEARHSCLEPQAECGLRGFHRDASGAIVEDVKECPCTIMGYPRLFTQRVCLAQVDGGVTWTITVRLTRSGKTLRRAEAQVIVN